MKPIAFLALLAAAAGAALADDSGGLIAHYRFNDGGGEILHDASGCNRHGSIQGAQWGEQGGQPCLRFSGGQYVDLGDTPALKADGDWAVLAWVYLDASPFPDEHTNWAVVDCEQYRKEGYILRIDGGTSKAMLRINQDRTEQYGFGTTVLENRRTHFVGAVRHGNEGIVYANGKRDAQFAIQPPRQGHTPVKISSPSQSFSGCIFEVAFFDRALTDDEIAERYWQGAERYDTGAKRGELRLTPHIYYREKQAVVEIDYFGVMPLATGERLTVSLSAKGGEAVSSQDIATTPGGAGGDYVFDLTGLAGGEYELCAELKSDHRNARASATFAYPAPPAVPPPPEKAVVEPLPADIQPSSFDAVIAQGGGLTVTVNGKTYPIESSFSVPGGGWNRLGCDGKQGGWEVNPGEHRMEAIGKHYSVSRRVEEREDRIVVYDAIANTSPEPVGIIVHHRLDTSAADAPMAYVGGRASPGVVTERSISRSPTLFLSQTGIGIGLVPSDDVFIVQSRGAYDDRKRLDLSTQEFAVDAGASYTLEWTVYVNGTGDYYDMVNAIRRHEGRNGVRLDGAIASLQGTQQKRDVSLVPDADYFDIRHAAYALVFCLSWCADDPGVSLEGIEFVERPVERQRIREMMERLASVRPDIKGMFHVAPQLYATNKPDELFADSRVIGPDGKQTVYGYNYENGSYFSRERYEANWRWWIYYPTLDNSFGKALLDSVDVMMGEMKCRGVFADGFLWGYGGEYTYDRWDGHSADIDPVTYEIKRKKGSVLLLTQDTMIAWSRKIRDKGGVLIANGVVPTRTICSEPLVTDKEVTEGPDVPLLPTPATLGDPALCKTETGLYKDVLNKLRYGNLYFFYNEPEKLTYESLTKRMYPITVEEVHAGCVKGKERIVAMNSGVYGWPDSRDLHVVYRYDSRGHRIDHNFMTTVDKDSARTRIDLNADESAVIERIPVQIETASPVNIIVNVTDNNEWDINANGHASIRVTVPGQDTQTIRIDGLKAIQVRPLSRQ